MIIKSIFYSDFLNFYLMSFFCLSIPFRIAHRFQLLCLLRFFLAVTISDFPCFYNLDHFNEHLFYKMSFSCDLLDFCMLNLSYIFLEDHKCKITVYHTINMASLLMLTFIDVDVDIVALVTCWSDFATIDFTLFPLLSLLYPLEGSSYLQSTLKELCTYLFEVRVYTSII